MIERHSQTAPHGFFGKSNRNWTVFQDQFSQFFCLLERIIGNTVDQTHRQGFLGINVPCGQDQIEGATLTDQTWQALRATKAWNQAQTNLGQTQFGAARGNPQIASQCQLETATKRETVDRRNGRDWHGSHRVHDVLTVQGQFAPTKGIFDAREFGNIRTRHKRFFTRTRDNQDLGFARLERRLKRLGNFAQGVVIEGIQGFRAVNGNGGNRVV